MGRDPEFDPGYLRRLWQPRYEPCGPGLKVARTWSRATGGAALWSVTAEAGVAFAYARLLAPSYSALLSAASFATAFAAAKAAIGAAPPVSGLVVEPGVKPRPKRPSRSKKTRRARALAWTGLFSATTVLFAAARAYTPVGLPLLLGAFGGCMTWLAMLFLAEEAGAQSRVDRGLPEGSRVHVGLSLTEAWREAPRAHRVALTCAAAFATLPFAALFLAAGRFLPAALLAAAGGTVLGWCGHAGFSRPARVDPRPLMRYVSGWTVAVVSSLLLLGALPR